MTLEFSAVLTPLLRKVWRFKPIGTKLNYLSRRIQSLMLPSLSHALQCMVKKKPLGNLLLATSILFSGNTFASISRLASYLNLQFFSESVFYDTQLKYLFLLLTKHGRMKAGIRLTSFLPRKLST